MTSAPPARPTAVPPPRDTGLAYASAGSLAARIAAGELSPVELVDASLERIDEVNPALNCFCFVWHEEAREVARTAAAAVARGERLGPLHGVPVVLKDTTPTAGHRTTLGSATHEHWVPRADAFIARALRRAGAIIVGKTTAPEFAYTLVTESRLWGVTRNPWNLDRTPGGSSGGSAAAVAAGCVPLAEGSDMGGSVRIPASWCGVVGLKPGLGRIPMDALPWLFDPLAHHGTLTRSIDDSRLFLAAVQGPDDSDIQSVTTPLDLDRPLPRSVAGMRLALSLDLGCWAVDAAVERAVRDAAEALRAAGAVVEAGMGPLLTSRDEEVWSELWAAYMAAFYGHLVDEYADTMEPGVLRLIERGEGMTAVQLRHLDRERTDLWRRVAAVLASHDAILCPTMATGPLPAARADRRALPPPPDDGRYHSPDMTAMFNLVAPCPALSVPCGIDDDGLPVGLQIVGPRWREDVVLRIGGAVEDAQRR